MIKKILDNKIKMTLIICATVITVTSMITGVEVPGWLKTCVMMLLGAG